MVSMDSASKGQGISAAATGIGCLAASALQTYIVIFVVAARSSLVREPASKLHRVSCCHSAVDPDGVVRVPGVPNPFGFDSVEPE